ncbi:MAG: exodeoxyribonuclease III [Actinomycetota bacterium]
MKKLTICSWNVNGIRAAHGRGSLDWFQEMQPDILCLQETKASLEQLPDGLREMEGYSAFYSAAERKGYSGVGLYSKPPPLEVRSGFGIPRFDGEGRALMADYGAFVLFNIYFPNGKQSRERLRYKLDFYNAFLGYADALRAKGKRVVACGDFNTAHKEIDLARPRENSKVSGFLPEERAWMDELVEHGYVDTFRMFNQEPGHYTWWDLKTRARERNIGWRIDYFFVSEDLREEVKASYMLEDVMGSDHCPLCIELKV